MDTNRIKRLIAALSPAVRRALERAAADCVARRAYDVLEEDLLLALWSEPDEGVATLVDALDVDPAAVRSSLARSVRATDHGNDGRPVWSYGLIELLREAWDVASLDLGREEVDGAILTLAWRRRRTRTAVPGASCLPDAEEIAAVLRRAPEAPAVASAADAPDTALDRFATDLTRQAKDGLLDAVFGREREIDQSVAILGRHRKNNPILVGDAGVGKTAIVEGLALRIADGRAPESLRDVRILALDLTRLQAGASVKGEFEARLQSVLEEIRDADRPIILFVDEAHTLIGAGTSGTGDAANLLKPALARGALRTIAATTWAEYKKYFEKDAALDRRFQLVRVDEPSEEQATVILRGVAEKYAAAHGVRVLDEAVVACVRLGNRYLCGRHQPDAGIDLLDTASAHVRLSQSSVPAPITHLEQRIEALQRELSSRRADARDAPAHHASAIRALDAQRAALDEEVAALRRRWQEERALSERVLELRDRIARLSSDEDDDEPSADVRDAYRAAREQLVALQDGAPFIHLEVSARTIADVVSEWTGVPAGHVLDDAAEAALRCEDILGRRIIGQPAALVALGRALRESRCDLGDPQAPRGVFLAAGPSGVGKTECGHALADVLRGRAGAPIVISMSEFQESHSVARLIGAPPGYVGHGEGGELTEAIRKQPYSVVLLDEIEKAHPAVLDLFHQVFDTGRISDSDGVEIDCANCIFYLTTNLGAEAIASSVRDGVDAAEDLVACITPELNAALRPSLVARMTVVPFLPLSVEALRRIAAAQLDVLAARLHARHGIRLELDGAVVDQIVLAVSAPEYGAREIRRVIRDDWLPRISTLVLETMHADTPPVALRLEIGPDATPCVTSNHGAPTEDLQHA